jgi:hypothetical protein
MTSVARASFRSRPDHRRGNVGAATGAPGIGRVNGRYFFSHSVAGLPAVTRRPRLADARSIVSQLRTGPRLCVEIDGRAAPAWAIVVANGCYAADVNDPARFDSPHADVLDVRIARADHHFARTRLLARWLRGPHARRPYLRRTCTAFEVNARSNGPVDVVLDADALRLTTPLRYEIDFDAWRVDASKR